LAECKEQQRYVQQQVEYERSEAWRIYAKLEAYPFNPSASFAGLPHLQRLRRPGRNPTHSLGPSPSKRRRPRK
jgi:hypothetical protein